VFRAWEEIACFNLLRADLGKAIEDHLQCTLEELHFSFALHEIAILEAAEELIIGIPHPGSDAACAISQIHLDVKDAIAVGTQLLVCRQVNFIKRIAIA
jgi:hypothetical protein